MRYLDIPCAVCGKKFAEADDVVTCPQCGTPHHRECWKKENRCANAEKHQEGFLWHFESQKTEALRQFEEMLRETEKKQPPKNNMPNVIECPFCGAQNYENELYCAVCHEPIHQNASAAGGMELESPEQRDKMIQDLQTFGGLDPQSSLGDITVQEYSAYLGGKSGAYIRRFMTIHGMNRILSWNWGAFALCLTSMFTGIVLAPAWFFFRKMNKIGAIVLAAVLALGVATAVVYASDDAYWTMMDNSVAMYNELAQEAMNGEADYMSMYSQLMLNVEKQAAAFSENCTQFTVVWMNAMQLFNVIAIPILVGLYSTGLYYKKAKKDILFIRAEHGQAPDYKARLSLKGGVSVSGAILSAAACCGIYMLQQYLPMILKSVGWIG